jgi:stage V sporulation protein SpoVS
MNVQTSAVRVNYVHSYLSLVVFPASVHVQISESDSRAHLTVGTIGGACRHPGQTDLQARGTKKINDLCVSRVAPVLAHFHA